MATVALEAEKVTPLRMRLSGNYGVGQAHETETQWWNVHVIHSYCQSSDVKLK